jgi:hypothetical protein
MFLVILGCYGILNTMIGKIELAIFVMYLIPFVSIFIAIMLLNSSYILAYSSFSLIRLIISSKRCLVSGVSVSGFSPS